MKLENQVCSLELSKKLDELGVKQNSVFGWHYHSHRESQAWACKHPEPNNTWYIVRGTDDLRPINWKNNVNNNMSAYTVAELGEMLPDSVHTQKETNGDGDWFCFFADYKGNSACEVAKTEADARAQMLALLIENKLITVEEINAIHLSEKQHVI